MGAGGGASDFGDFGFDDTEGSGGAGGGESASGSSGAKATDDEWGGDDEWGDKPKASQKAAAAPPPKDPWAREPNHVGSSLFAYDCASLHASEAPAPAPVKVIASP